MCSLISDTLSLCHGTLVLRLIFDRSQPMIVTYEVIKSSYNTVPVGAKLGGWIDRKGMLEDFCLSPDTPDERSLNDIFSEDMRDHVHDVVNEHACNFIGTPLPLWMRIGGAS